MLVGNFARSLIFIWVYECREKTNMSFDFTNSEKAKYISAKHALGLIKDGMRVGLGTGSTASWFIVLLAELIRRDDLTILATSTSTQTRILAESLGIKVMSLKEIDNIDLTVDGADEFDCQLNLIKGGGGALLQEKIVAAASSKMIVIADNAKRVKTLGKFPLPIEIVPFGVETIERNLSKLLASLGYKKPRGVLRKNVNEVFLTDEGHYILDYDLSRMDRIEELALNINNLPGVVEHGIFIGLCDEVFVGKGNGSVDIYTNKARSTFSYQIDLDEMSYIKSLIEGI